MIRILIVDDHPAVRGGLVAAVRSEPGFMPQAVASGMTAALAEADRHSFDVALVDFQLPDGDGLRLCHELKLLPRPPAVLVYSAFARAELALAATVAGADGVVHKGAPLNELLDAVRTVARGGKALPDLRAEAMQESSARLEPDDLPILGMRLDGATPAEIASVLHLEQNELARRLTAMLSRLASRVGSASSMNAE